MANIFKLLHLSNGEKSKIIVEYGQQTYNVRPRDFVNAATQSPVDMTDVAIAMSDLLERGLATLHIEDAIPASALASSLPALHQGS